MNPSTQRQAFGLKILNAKHHAVRKLKAEGHQAEIHGNKFWNSSFLIMDHLKRHPPKQGLRVLEIGCGWGGFALQAARERGAHVTAVTVSQAQFDEARKRVAAAGLNVKVDIQLRDYRKLDRQWDHVVSVEMIEAVWSSPL